MFALCTPFYTLITLQFETAVVYPFIAILADWSVNICHTFKYVCLTTSTNLCIQFRTMDIWLRAQGGTRRRRECANVHANLCW